MDGWMDGWMEADSVTLTYIFHMRKQQVMVFIVINGVVSDIAVINSFKYLERSKCSVQFSLLFIIIIITI